MEGRPRAARARRRPRLARGARHVVGGLTSRGLTAVQALYAVAGVWLALALALAALGLWGFVELADEVAEGATQRVDHAVMTWLDARGTPVLDRWARTVTELGSWLVLAVMALLASALLWTRGERRAVALLWIGLVGVAFLGELLKALFGRERPSVFELRTFEPRGHAFPSGHALNAAAAYTLFAFLVARLGGSWALRAGTFTAAGVVVLLVAASRVYLGVHYPSDVLAGILVGFAWGMACVFAVYVLRELQAPS